MKGTNLQYNSLLSTASKAKLLLKFALSLHVHPREVAHTPVWLMGKMFVFHMAVTQTDSYAQGSITAPCMFMIPAVSYPVSLDDPLSHKADSHSYLSSSAWVMAYYQLHFPSHSAYFCVKEHMCQFGEVGGKWNKQASLCTLVRSTQPPTSSEIGCCQLQPSTLQPLAIAF